jgi:hypothetical protein
MDRTAPTFLPLDLNQVPGTAAAPISVDVRSADQIPADNRMLSVGRKGCDAVKAPPSMRRTSLASTSRDQAPIVCTAVGTVLRFIS